MTTKPTSPIMAPMIAESTEEAVEGVNVRAAGMSSVSPTLAAPQARIAPATAPPSGTSHRLWRMASRRRNRRAQVMPEPTAASCRATASATRGTTRRAPI